MCNLSQGIENRALARGHEKGVKEGIEKGVEKGIRGAIDICRKLRQHRIIPGGVACQKIFCEMIQKAQAILAGLASIFGKYHGKFWRDTPPEPQGANCAVVP